MFLCLLLLVQLPLYVCMCMCGLCGVRNLRALIFMQAYGNQIAYDISYFRPTMDERGQGLPSPQEVCLLFYASVLSHLKMKVTNLVNVVLLHQ